MTQQVTQQENEDISQLSEGQFADESSASSGDETEVTEEIETEGNLLLIKCGHPLLLIKHHIANFEHGLSRRCHFSPHCWY